MEQLPLDISPAAAPSFDNFVAGANAELLARLRELAAGTLREAVIYLWGEPGSGRTHLLCAAQRADPDIVVADDVERLDAHAQQALFVAINAAREGKRAVLAAGNAPPAQLALREDLRSRLAWGLVYQVKPLSDTEKAAQMRTEAGRRGLQLTEEVVRYLLTHLPRDLGSLHRVLDVLDRYSLVRQRPVTLRLVRDALAAMHASAELPRQIRTP